MTSDTSPAERGTRLRGDIAIVGMACTYPQAPDLATLWENVVAGADAVVEMPAGRIPSWFYDPRQTPIDGTSWRRGGFLDPELPFDPLQFGIMPLIMETADPEQFLVLKAAEAALRDAGYSPDHLQGDRTEIVVGRGNYPNRGTKIGQHHFSIVNEVLEVLAAVRPDLSEDELAGVRKRIVAGLPRFEAENAAALIPNFTSGRVASRFDFMGTNFTVDAACASSLIALEIGVRDLLTYKCDTALVGGVFILSDLLPIVLFTKLGALSRRAEIRPFDAQADGTLMGEGVGLVVLKRLADAVEAGDRIYAVVKGVGTASDGHAVSLLAPRVEGEELALRRAYAMAGVDPATIGLIEAHGTATPTGDLIEIEALVRVFGSRQPDSVPRCAIGSIKSMIGHTMPAAGAAGLIKAALSLYHRVLPPTLHCDQPNPKLGLDETPFYLNTAARPWIEGSSEHPRRAGVNAFGFGGANAHVILEEYRDPREDRLPSLLTRWPTEVCVLEAPSREALIERIRGVLEFLTPARPIELKDLAFTLNGSLSGLRHRLALVAGSTDDLRGKLERAAARLADPGCAQIKDLRGSYYFSRPLAESGTLAFLFPGEGAQYVEMLGDLATHFPVVRRALDRADQIARLDQVFPPPWPNERRRAEERLWSRISTASQAVLATDYALLALLEQLGLQPDAVVGHSSGDFVALLAAGVVFYDEAMANNLAHLWEAYDAPLSGADQAGLLAVGAGKETALEKLGDLAGQMMVAMDNCPHQVILAGPAAIADTARDRLLAAGTFCERLAFDRPYHTPAFVPQLGPLHQQLAGVEMRPPRTKIYSCTLADVYPSDVEAIRRLVIDHWVRPVRFQETIQQMYRDGVRLFVEVGPRGNLTAFVDDLLRGESYLAIAADSQRRHGLTQLNHLLAVLAAHGVPMNISELYARRSPRLLNLLEQTAPLEDPPARLTLPLTIPRLTITASPPGAAPQPANGSVTHAPHEPGPSLGGAMTDASVPLSQPAPEQVSRAPASPIEAPPVEAAALVAASTNPHPVLNPDDPMVGYLKTMEQFLAVQQSVMEGFLGGIAPAGGGSLVEQDYPLTAAIETTAIGHQLPENPSVDDSYPLLGTVTSYQEGQYLRAERALQLEHDQFLLDHKIGWQVSIDPTLRALSVIPMTVSIEIMAEAAAALLPSLRVVGLEQVRTSRWLEVTERGRLLEISAQRLPNSADPRQRVQVTIKSRLLEAGAADQSEPAAEGIVLVDTAYPPPPEPSAFELSNPQPCQATVTELYDYLFHGPQFRAIQAVHQLGDDGISGDLVTLPLDQFLGSRSSEGLLTDPVLLDGAGQLLGAWASQRISEAEVIFPIQIDALTFFGPRAPAGEVVPTRASVRTFQSRRLRGDMELLGPDGRVQVQIVGWQDYRFHVPANRSRLFHDPLAALLGELWETPTAPLPSEGGYVGILLDGLGEQGSSTLQEFIAEVVLSRAEREVWWNLRGPSKRRAEWLLGRAALKDATRVYLERRHGLRVYPADIEVRADANGRPTVEGYWTAGLAEVPGVSLAHSGMVAVAITGSGGPRAYLGVDLERISPHTPEFLSAALRPEEWSWLEALDEPERIAWITRFWCAKEAVGKAVGHGLPEGPSGVVVEHANLASGQVTLRLRGQLEQLVPRLAGVAVVAYTAVVGDLVVASTVCEQMVE